MAKGKNNPIPYFMGEPNEPFLRMPNSLMKSHAWKHLTARQSRLYMDMARHYKGQEIGEVGKKYPDITEYQTNDLFFYPWSEGHATGLYNRSITNKKPFYDDIKALEAHGFIKQIARGHNGAMSIYQYSDGWKKWKPPPN